MAKTTSPSFTSLFVIAALLTCCFTANGSDVISLSPITFNTVVGIATKPAVVNFYSSKDCDKCATFDVELEKVGEYFRDDEVSIAKFDCGRLKGFCTFYAIKEYPTIKYFDSSERHGVAYPGALKAAPLINFIEEHVAAAPSPDEATSSPETENLVGHMAGEGGGIPEEVIPRPVNEEIKVEENVKESEEKEEEVERVAILMEGDDETLVRSPSGRDPELDKLAEGFVGCEDKESRIEEAKKSEKKNAKYYVKYMEMIMKNGEGFVEEEKARLEKIIAEGTNPRMDEFITRRNIIQAF